MSEYKFTQDWFNWAPAVWEQLIPMLPARKKFLEIGSFEGRSTVWTVENMMEDGGEIYCIDTWEGGEEHSAEDMSPAEDNFRHNRGLLMDKYADRHISIIKGTSLAGLAEWLISPEFSNEVFDFIYIDGSHIAKDVLTDACMAWPLLKLEGFMVFDDYAWGNPRDALHRPKIAIDAFTNIFGETAEIVHVGYQLVVRKKG
jgi:predicted O-methyltransferase YrrM